MRSKVTTSLEKPALTLVLSWRFCPYAFFVDWTTKALPQSSNQTFTAIRLSRQAFISSLSRSDRPFRPSCVARVPASGGMPGSLAKSVKEVPDLIHSEPSALGHVDDLQIVQDAGFVNDAARRCRCVLGSRQSSRNTGWQKFADLPCAPLRQW